MVLTAAFTGCLTTDAHVTIHDDGSGVLRMEVFPPPAISGAVDDAGVEAIARRALEGVDGASFETEHRLGQTFYIVEVPFADFRRLTTNVADGATMAGQSLTPFTRFDLRELPDGGWSLDAVTNPLDRAAAFSEGSPLVGLQALAGTDDAGVGLELSVTLPGSLTDSNADSREGDTATWNLTDPTATYELAMRTEATPLLTPLQWVLAGLLALFLLGAVLMFVGASGPVKRRSLRKPSRREHEAFMPPNAGEPPKQPKERRGHVRRRERMVAEERTGWEDPLVHAPLDPMSQGPTEPGPHPHRPLPPLTDALLDAEPDPLAGEDPAGPLRPFPDSSPPTPEAVHTAHDPAHMDQPGHAEEVPPPEVLPPGPSDDPDHNPNI